DYYCQVRVTISDHWVF
nr:immunoglobulin light chain junction region [Macaca mulatta]